MTNNCKFCSKDISTLRSNAEYCNKDCRKYDYNNIRTEKLRITSIEEYKNASKDSYVACKICGHCAPDLSNHILKIHKISAGDYKEQFKVNVVKCKDLCDTVRGENNPGFQHGGKLSIFSDNFLHNDGTEEFKNKQAEIKQKAYDKSLAIPENRSNTVDYWQARGNTLKESKQLLSKRQSTFSLEKCIERFGDDKGLDIWKARQIKWLATLDGKSDEEKAAINRKKTPSLTFRQLWSGEINKNGIFYIISLSNGNIKLGISTKENVELRYGLNRKEIINKFEHNMPVSRAFVIEQIMKRELKEYSISKEEQLLDFGYTETFKTESHKVCDLFVHINKDKDLYGRFIRHYPKAVRHNFEEVCRSI